MKEITNELLFLVDVFVFQNQKRRKKKRRLEFICQHVGSSRRQSKKSSSRIALRETKKGGNELFLFCFELFLFLFIWFFYPPPRKSLSSSVASSSFDYIIYSRESRAHILLGHTNGSFFMARSQRKRSFVRSFNHSGENKTTKRSSNNKWGMCKEEEEQQQQKGRERSSSKKS